MFQDALQSLFDWLETVEPSLSSETAIMGDTQTVHILMDNHKVQFVLVFFTSCCDIIITKRKQLAHKSFAYIFRPSNEILQADRKSTTL